MQNQSVFQYHQSQVRTFTDTNNELWFLANDVCDILGYKNTSLTVTKHCKPKGVSKRYTLTDRGNQEMVYINEPNLYRLIIKSRKPEAQFFEEWVMEDVLPAIRKTGSYSLRGNYHFPLETASPRKRVFTNAWLTPRVILNTQNRAPELELLEALQQDGFDVTGAKVRIYAMYDIARQLINMQNQLADARRYLSSADRIIKAQLDERGHNIDFTTGRPVLDILKNR